MEKRLLLAFVLMGLVIFGSQYLLPTPEAPKKANNPAPPAAAKTPTSTPAPGMKADSKAATPEAGATEVAASKEETYRVETDLYSVQFSNRGAVVTSWVLKKFKDSSGKPMELVHLPGAAKVGYPFSVQLNDKELNPNVNANLFTGKASADGLSLDFEFASGNTKVRKSFHFEKDKYLVRVDSDLVLQGTATEHNLAWRGGFGDHYTFNAHSLGTTLRFNTSNNKLELKTAKEASERWSTDRGNFLFAGIQDAYFAAVAMNKNNTNLELQTTSDRFIPLSSTDKKEEANIGMAIGGAANNKLSLFVGPKDIDVLRRVDPKLEQLVDFGTWFGIVAKPLFLALNYVNDKYIHNYGWSIVAVTLIINILTLPLKFSSMKSMQKTALIQPELARINDKYKGVAMTDPKAAKKNEEIMELYKKHGVNPAGGCLPLLLQMPVLFGFYTVLSVAIEMRQAQWLWVGDLSQPETLAIRILPVLMVATQFLLQRMTPTAGLDPSQQKIMMFMPLMFAFMFWGASSGLVLYWLTSNIFAIAQQYGFSKLMPSPVTPPGKTIVNVKKR